jgi:hypothetical protein
MIAIATAPMMKAAPIAVTVISPAIRRSAYPRRGLGAGAAADDRRVLDAGVGVAIC